MLKSRKKKEKALSYLLKKGSPPISTKERAKGRQIVAGKKGVTRSRNPEGDILSLCPKKKKRTRDKGVRKREERKRGSPLSRGGKEKRPLEFLSHRPKGGGKSGCPALLTTSGRNEEEGASRGRKKGVLEIHQTQQKAFSPDLTPEKKRSQLTRLANRRGGKGKKKSLPV